MLRKKNLFGFLWHVKCLYEGRPPNTIGEIVLHVVFSVVNHEGYRQCSMVENVGWVEHVHIKQLLVTGTPKYARLTLSTPPSMPWEILPLSMHAVNVVKHFGEAVALFVKTKQLLAIVRGESLKVSVSKDSRTPLHKLFKESHPVVSVTCKYLLNISDVCAVASCQIARVHFSLS